MTGDKSATGLTVVPRTPNLAKEFGRAVLTARGRPGGAGQLTESRLVHEGVSIDRDLLLRYQRLCGFGVSDQVPHTFPHLLGFPLQAQLMAGPGFPLPLPGLVHIGNETTLHRELLASDLLDLQVHAENLAPHAKGTTVDLVAHASIGGAPVWDSRSTYLHRGRPQGPAAELEKPPTVVAPRLASRWKLPADLGRQYAAVAGDINPIHLHRLTAKMMGFPRAIAHGMWTYARTLAALGPQVNRPSHSRVWFAKPVLLPGSVDLQLDANPAGQGTTAALVATKDPAKRHLTVQVDWL